MKEESKRKKAKHISASSTDKDPGISNAFAKVKMYPVVSCEGHVLTTHIFVRGGPGYDRVRIIKLPGCSPNAGLEDGAWLWMPPRNLDTEVEIQINMEMLKQIEREAEGLACILNRCAENDEGVPVPTHYNAV